MLAKPGNNDKLGPRPINSADQETAINTTLLRNRNFNRLWLAQIVSTLGDILYEVGVMVTVFQQTGSALQTVGVMLAKTLPPFLLGPVAGALVDRYPRKTVMIIMDFLRAGLVALLLLYATGPVVNVWGIYAVVAGLAAAGAFYDPARMAIIPSIVPKTGLVQANSLLLSTKQAALAAGYLLGGVLILSLGFKLLIWLNLLSFLLSALVTALLVMPAEAAPARLPFRGLSLGRDIADGLAYLRRHPLARPLVTMEVLEHFPHAIWTSALLLVFTQQALKAGPDGWGYQNAAFYGGQILGALVAVGLSAWLGRRAGQVILWNAVLSGGFTLAYAYSPGLAPAVALCVLFGPTSSMRDVAQDSLLQAAVDPAMLGRVHATRTMLARLAFMVAGLAFAWLADQTPVRWIYVAGGLLYFGTALYAAASAAIRQGRIAPVAAEVN